ncbi:hypothetical protein EDD86DRAFT_276308 [Gorgonomyces haynaldii]|nr:hypothetical protein EDD86DRAFT_276308 [Gorgonomyces haynaldii]
MSEGYKKNIGYIGSISLLITSITGPGMVILPFVYQQAGWITPTLAFIVFGILATVASLFVCEALTRFPGNDSFQRNIEFTVMVHQFYGRYWYYLFLFILYGSLQSVNIASLVGSAQAFDSLFVTLLGGTCGYGIQPISGFYCVTQSSNSNSPFGSNYMIVTFGYLVVIAIILPLVKMNLNDNVFLQLVSWVYNFVFVFTLIIEAIALGMDSNRMPAIGSSQANVIGAVLFNFAMANTVPSWVNAKHPAVSTHSSIWASTIFAIILYVASGVFGALTFDVDENTNLLQAMYTAPLSSASKGWMTFIYLLFPILTYITSIPVSMIIVRLNFLAAKICTEGQANFWAVTFPFLVGIPMQTGSIVTYFGTYTSVIFQSTCNFFAPFLIYLFLSKRNMVLAQSVLDELEFLDLNAGIKKYDDDDDEDFDYVYHLPHANPAAIVKRDPLNTVATKLEKSKKNSSMMSVGSRLSNGSKMSAKAMRALLDPRASGAPKRLQKRSGMGSGSMQSLHPESVADSRAASRTTSINKTMDPATGMSEVVLTMDLRDTNEGTGSFGNLTKEMMGSIESKKMGLLGMTDKRLPGNLDKPPIPPVPMSYTLNANTGQSLMTVPGLAPIQASKPIPSAVKQQLFDAKSIKSTKDVGESFKDSKSSLQDEADMLIPFKDFASFRAIPAAFTRYVSSNAVAFFGLLVMILAVFQVVYSTITDN